MPRSRLLLTLLALSLSAFSAGALASATAAAGPPECNRKISDGGGYTFEFGAAREGTELSLFDLYGAIGEAFANSPTEKPPGPVSALDAYDYWGGVYVYSAGADVTAPVLADKYNGPLDACVSSADGREIAYPVLPMHGLEVQHRWLVGSGALHGARVLTVLHNPSAAPIAVTVLQGDATAVGNLGSDTKTLPRATSDGSGVFSPASLWGVSTDGSVQDGDPALAHVWDGPGGAIRAREVVLGIEAYEDVLYWDWAVTVPPGGTSSLISYEVMNAVPSRKTADEVALAAAEAEAHEKQAPASLYEGMSAAEIAGTLNWARPAAPVAKVAAVRKANAAKPVLLDASKSQAAVAGLPQCAPTYAWKTDDGAKGSGAKLRHLFGPGAHTATVTVGNSCGGSATAKVKFKVAKAIGLGKVTLDRTKGTATLKVRALGAGKLTLAGKGVVAQAKRLRKAGTVTLSVKPSAKLRSQLAATGKAKVRLTLTLKPKGGKASKLSKTLTLLSR